jgi:hypothetical protein
MVKGSEGGFEPRDKRARTQLLGAYPIIDGAPLPPLLAALIHYPFKILGYIKVLYYETNGPRTSYL